MPAQGASAPVVFLHSAGLTPQMWQSQVEAVALAQPAGTDDRDRTQTPALAPWLSGLRPGKAAELSIRLSAAEVLSSLDGNGWEKAHLVGHQLGAMVAMQTAADAPDRVAGLVLSGAFAPAGRVALAMQKSLVRALPNKAFAASGATKSDLIKALDLLAKAASAIPLKAITAPALVIAGANDPALPAAQQLAAKLPQARLVELAGAGPNPSLEASEEYNLLLVDFLADRV